MPVGDHPSFDRPLISQRLWRYTDVAKFVDLLTSGSLWLSNVEVLAVDDPYEGLPGAVQFPHRMWRTIDEVPNELRQQILGIYGREPGCNPDSAFRNWFMVEEQRCIMTRSGRRDYYVSCWHAAAYESAAMWKVYSSPGGGVAIVTNGARIGSALSGVSEDLNLGTVRYEDPDWIEIGSSNAFDSIMVKRSSFSYEKEVRLVHWRTGEIHDALANDTWNDETMRFDNLIEDSRPIRQGISVSCDINVLIERVIISPFAPPWYKTMIERLRDSLGFDFLVNDSRLMAAPQVIP